jgi:hypothetical protein
MKLFCQKDDTQTAFIWWWSEYLNLVNSRDNLARGMAEQPPEVCDAEV